MPTPPVNATVSDAVPAESGAPPITAEPSWKTTVPVGVPAPGVTAATVAVKVTDWPTAAVDVEAATVVAVAA